MNQMRKYRQYLLKEKDKSQFDTIPKLLRWRSQRWPDKISMRHKNYGVWQEFTWKTTYQRAKYFGLGLISLGLEPNDKVFLIGDNEPELFWAIYGILMVRGIYVPGYSDALDSEMQFLMANSDSKFAVCEDQEQIDKLLKIADNLPNVKKAICWDMKGIEGYTNPWIVSFKEVESLGRDYDKANPGAIDELIKSGKNDDVAVINYTSGTTGVPKGSVRSHYELQAQQNILSHFLPLTDDDDTVYFLPIAWGDIYIGTPANAYQGYTLCFPEEPETLMEDMREIGPSVVPWGSRQWEGIASTVQVKINDANVLKKFLFNLALPVGFKIVDFQSNGKRPTLFWAGLWKAADLVFNPLRDRLGMKKLKCTFHIGSAIGVDTCRYLWALGIPINQSYGSMEMGMVSSHWPGEKALGTVGQIAPTVEVRVTAEGALAVRGPSVSKEYYKDLEATSRMIKDGWFHTGDAMTITDDGYLIFFDRVSEMGQLRGSGKYSPSYIGAELRFSRYIKDAMIIGGPARDYLLLLINIDFDSVGKWAMANHIHYTTLVDLSQKDEVSQLVLGEIQRINRKLPEDAKIGKYIIFYKDFDPDEGEMTRSRKIKRAAMEQKYAELIEASYNDELSISTICQVIYRDGRTGTVNADLKIRECVAAM